MRHDPGWKDTLMVKKAAQATPNQLLRRARLERGSSEKVVADRIGAPNDMMVTRWERGTAFPSAYYIRAALPAL